jgi:hypothetical protein
MPFNTALIRNIDALGVPTKKEKLYANTPLKHFLRPIIEEAMLRRKAMMVGMQPPQLPAAVGGMVEPPSISPLQNALVSAPQGGGGGTPSLSQGKAMQMGRST